MAGEKNWFYVEQFEEMKYRIFDILETACTNITTINGVPTSVQVWYVQKYNQSQAVLDSTTRFFNKMYFIGVSYELLSEVLHKHINGTLQLGVT